MFGKLPCLDEKYPPQVIFLGQRDEWMKKAGKYKYIYEMDTNIAYDWFVQLEAKLTRQLLSPCFQSSSPTMS
jgi:hypothetical protein